MQPDTPACCSCVRRRPTLCAVGAVKPPQHPIRHCDFT